MSHKHNPPRQDRRRIGRAVVKPPTKSPTKPGFDRANGRDNPFSKSRPVTTRA